MFGRSLAKIATPTVLGSILLLVAPAWAQSGKGKDNRVGDTDRTGQTINVNKNTQTPANQVNQAAANAAVRQAEMDAAVRMGTYGERNSAIYQRSMPYGGFGTTYSGYAYPNYYVSSYYYPYYQGAVAYPYAAVVPTAPTVPVGVQPVVPTAVQQIVPTVPTTPGLVPVSATTSVLVTVDVPPDAEIWFNGAPTAQRGTVRRYISPPLNPGMDYTYFVRARWTEGDVPIDQTRRVTVHAGDQLTVDFPYVR